MINYLDLFQCVPYLISMSTDVEAGIRVKADQQLQEIEKKYPGFVHVSIKRLLFSLMCSITLKV